MYVVIAGGVVLLFWDLLAGDDRARELARIARLRGVLPITARLASSFNNVHDRSLCLIDDGFSGESGSPLVEAADTVVPGHGSPHERDAALRLLDEDVAYLDALERGDDRRRLPAGRDSPRQRQIDYLNGPH